VALGQEQVPQGALASLLLELLHDGRDLPARGTGVELLVEDVLVGIDVLGHEFGDLLQVHLGLLRVLEIHGRPPLALSSARLYPPRRAKSWQAGGKERWR